jgi:hypothetical protein
MHHEPASWDERPGEVDERARVIFHVLEIVHAEYQVEFTIQAQRGDIALPEYAIREPGSARHEIGSLD